MYHIYIFIIALCTLRLLRNVPDLYFPMLWFEIKAQMTPELAKHARMATFIIRSRLVSVGIWGLLIILFTIIPVAIIFWYRYKVKVQGN